MITKLVLTSAAVLGLTNMTLAGETDLSREAAIASVDFCVAPGGKDTNPGTAAAPFATLERARQAVREKVAAGLTRDVRVLIRGGIYEQAAAFEFGPPDSGSEKYSITYAAYPGEAGRSQRRPEDFRMEEEDSLVGRQV